MMIRDAEGTPISQNRRCGVFILHLPDVISAEEQLENDATERHDRRESTSAEETVKSTKVPAVQRVCRKCVCSFWLPLQKAVRSAEKAIQNSHKRAVHAPKMVDSIGEDRKGELNSQRRLYNW